MSPVASRTLSEQFDATAAAAGLAGAAAALAGGLTAEHVAAVDALKAAAVQRRLQVVPVTVGAAGLLRIPLASWLLCESLIRWAGSWQPGEIDAAADTLQRSVVDAAATGGLQGQVGLRLLWCLALRSPAANCNGRPSAVLTLSFACGLPAHPLQAYWLACSLAAGGLMKARTIGKRDVGHLLRLGERGGCGAGRRGDLGSAGLALA